MSLCRIYRYTLFYCALLYCFTCKHLFFINWRSVATLCQSSLLVPFLQWHLLILCICVTLCNTWNISNFLIIIMFVMVIFGIAITTCWRLRWWLPFFRNKAFEINTCTLFLWGPGSSDGKESAGNAGNPGSTPGSGNGYPLQYFYLENSMDQGA